MSPSILLWTTSLVTAYLFGSVSCAIVVSSVMHLPDPRSTGSKNPGATNVLRISGRKDAAAYTLLGDGLKGFIPVCLVLLFGGGATLAAWALLAAVLGHVFPVFFKFEGGKGVATALGGLLALSLPLGGLVIVTWLLTAVCFRYSSLAAISAFVGLPFYALMLGQWREALPLALISLGLLWRHRANLQRLNAGIEPKIGKK